MKAVRWLALVPMLLALVSGCSNKGSKVVAKVGEKEITVREVEDAYRRAADRFAYLGDDLDAKREFLNEVINKELLGMEARSRGLDKDDRVRVQYEKAKRQLLLSNLYEDEVLKKVKVTRKDLKEELDKLEEERYIYQIKVPTEEEAREIVDSLKHGADFEALARERSVLPTADQGGLDGWGWRGKYATPFEEAAFSLKPGEFSDVVKTVAGYHVIKVTDIRKVDLGTVEENKARLEKAIRERKEKERQHQYLESLIDKYQVKFSDDNIAFLFQKVSEERDPNGSPYLPKFMGLGDQKKVLVSYDGGEVTIADYIKKFTEKPPLFKTEVRDEGHMRSLVNGIITDRLLDIEAEKRGYIRRKEIKDRLDRKLEEIMVSTLYEDEIQGSIIVSDDEVKKYFEQHAEDYYVPEMVNVYILTFPRKADAEKFYQDLKSGADFDSLAKLGRDRRILTQDSTRGLVPKGKYPKFDDIFFSMQVGDVVGPVRGEDGYKVFKLLEKKEREQMTWEKAAPYARRRLEAEKADELLVDWLKELKKKWGVEVYEDNLKLVSLKSKKG